MEVLFDWCTLLCLVSRSIEDEEELKMTKDCFEILTCMAGHPLGRIAMCEHGSLSALCHAFIAGNHCKHSKGTFTVLNDFI